MKTKLEDGIRKILELQDSQNAGLAKKIEKLYVSPKAKKKKKPIKSLADLPGILPEKDSEIIA